MPDLDVLRHLTIDERWQLGHLIGCQGKLFDWPCAGLRYFTDVDFLFDLESGQLPLYFRAALHDAEEIEGKSKGQCVRFHLYHRAFFARKKGGSCLTSMGCCCIASVANLLNGIVFYLLMIYSLTVFSLQCFQKWTPGAPVGTQCLPQEQRPGTVLDVMPGSFGCVLRMW